MSKLRLFAALFLVVGILFPAAAQDKDKDKDKDKPKDDKGKVLLKWDLKKGTAFYQKMTTETKQTMKVMNNDVVQTQKQTFYFSWTPVEQKGDDWIIEQKIEGVVMDIDIGGSKITYDSTKEQGGTNPLGEFFKALVGSSFKLTLDGKTMTVKEVEGREAFLKKLTDANPQMKQLLEQILSKDALKEMAQPTFAAIPNKEVAKGESWKKESELNMGPIGKYKNTFTYTYEGKDDKDKKLDKIKVETKLEYVAPADQPGGALPFRIKAADLKTTSASGTILFDPEKGRIEKSNMNLEMKGKLTIEIGGQTTEVDLSQVQDTKVETADKSQLPAKQP
jgi:hypothetical protein